MHKYSFHFIEMNVYHFKISHKELYIERVQSPVSYLFSKLMKEKGTLRDDLGLKVFFVSCVCDILMQIDFKLTFGSC